MARNIRETAAWGISIMGWFFAFCNFIPIFVLHSQSLQQASSGSDVISDMTASSNSTSIGDDYYYIVGFDEQPTFREAAISALIISIPLALDTMLDMLPSWLNTFLFAESRQLPLKSSGTSLFHLTPAEKLSFIVGVVCLSTISYEPVRSYETPALLYVAFLNGNTVLTACPIMAFLTRCAPTWTPLRSTVIAFLVCTAALLSSFSTLLDMTSIEYRRIALAISTILTTAFGLFILMCLVSAVNTIWFQVPYPVGLPVDRSPANNNTSDSNSVQDTKNRATDRFRNCVVAAHMAATFIEAVLNPVWYFEASQLKSSDLTTIIYILVASAAIVYLTEFRVRKSEVTRALIDLLDAKKSYVRYISHELRTPMNAAFLGLKFVIDNMKKDSESDPTIADTYDTLCDVQTACSTAVDILNDLLTFEKLESGILELHRTDVCVLDLVRDCVSLFSAQAREKNIQLVCELEVVESDSVHVDKFKIDQVLRNLISNAIKFSPRGGTVRVSASFSDSAIDHHHQPIKSDAVLGIDTGISSESNDLATQICGKLVIEVIDEGAGMSTENQKRLFSEIVQFNPEKLQAGGGSGFGLFICKGIVDLHGGNISVFSEGEGKGSTFMLELPMKRATEAIEPAIAPRALHDPHAHDIENHLSGAVNDDETNNDNSTMRSISVSTSKHQLRRLSRGSDSSRRSSLTRPGSASSVPQHDEHIGIDTAIVSPNDVGVHVDNTNHSTLHVADSGDGACVGSGGVECKGDVNIHHHTKTNPPTDAHAQSSPSFNINTRKRSNSVQHSTQKTTQYSDTCKDPSYEVLVVDDSPMNRKMLIKILKAAGHMCEEAEDGIKAVEKVKQRMSSEGGKAEYDVILMDFVMPNMDGPTATKELRKLAYTGIIFGVTGNGLESDIRHFESCGANKVLVKPFKLEEFKALVKLMREKM